MTTVRDVMTANPCTCSAHATLQEVARKMLDEDVGFIPLMDKGRIAGVITDRDLAVRATAKGVDPRKARAIAFGTERAETAAADADVDEAIRLMEHWQIRRLLVVEGERPLGVVSLGDLAEATPRQAEEVLVEVSKSPRTLAHVHRA